MATLATPATCSFGCDKENKKKQNISATGYVQQTLDDVSSAFLLKFHWNQLQGSSPQNHHFLFSIETVHGHILRGRAHCPQNRSAHEAKHLHQGLNFEIHADLAFFQTHQRNATPSYEAGRKREFAGCGRGHKSQQKDASLGNFTRSVSAAQPHSQIHQTKCKIYLALQSTR